MRRKLCFGAAAATAALSCLVPASALGLTVNATTTGGGSCQVQSNASRAGSNITYGVQVTPCTARFGIAYGISQGVADDTTKGEQDAGGNMPQTSGPIPYSNSKNFVVSLLNFGDAYATRVDVSVVLNSGVLSTTKRHKRRCHRGDGNADDRGLGPGGDHDADDRRSCRRKQSTRVNTLEQWIDQGPYCIVTTTFHSSDTLGCILVDPLP
jgi:hypothetical protein